MDSYHHTLTTVNSGMHIRQYRLIHFITCELVIVCSIVIYPYVFPRLWYLVALISLGGILALMNLWFLIRTQNTKFCGHALILIIFLTIVGANYLVRGIGASYSLWFYVIPLLAVSLIGRSGLLIYSPLSLIMIIGFGSFSIPAFYHLSPHQLAIIGWANHLFAFLIIVTTLDSLTRENRRYEQLLNDKNYLLHLEKDKYHYLARFDQLTNLPNHQFFKQHLQEIIDSLANNYCVTVFFMDLDNLKYVNDHYGHTVGDQLLLQTARRLLGCFREGDFIARLGGDEFTAIVLHARDEKIPEVIAKRIVHEFNQAFTIENIEHYSSISIGLSTCPDDAQTVVDLIIKADQAMYAAKKIRGSSFQTAIQSILKVIPK